MKASGNGVSLFSEPRSPKTSLSLPPPLPTQKGNYSSKVYTEYPIHFGKMNGNGLMYRFELFMSSGARGNGVFAI
jgi:hypothetical protein